MYKSGIVFLSLFLFFNCENYGELHFVASLPDALEEVSGIEKTIDTEILWMHNDSGNKPKIYGLNTKGEILREIRLEADNIDWEDITSDTQGNLYIADFGNNKNNRKDLRILKINKSDLQGNNRVIPEIISFSYPKQKKFPPKKKKRFFDAESLVYYDGNLYVFTKSRVKNAYGFSSLYRISSEPGNYKAEHIGDFETCHDNISCWITGACVSPDKTKIALLNHHTVFVFSDFTGDNFFNGNLEVYDLKNTSQKEGITFKNNDVLYITDERSHGKGGNLYEFRLTKP